MQLSEMPEGFRLELDHLKEPEPAWRAYIVSLHRCNRDYDHPGPPFCKGVGFGPTEAIDQSLAQFEGWINAGGPWPIPEGTPGR